MRGLVRTWAAARVGLPLLLHLACTGEDPDLSGAPNSGSDGGSSGGLDGAGDGGSSTEDASAPPASGPASLRFHNQEFREGFAEGRVRIAKAADESDVAEYVLYWGTSADVKVPGDPIAVLPRGPDEHVFMLAPGTPIPPGATHLLASTRNAKGEGPHASATLTNVPQFVDTSASLPADAGTLHMNHPRALVDATRERLLVVGPVSSTNKVGMGTLACKLDATACSFTFACADDDCAMNPTPTLDDVNGKLLIAAFGADDALAGYVCTPDGTTCKVSTAPGSGQPSGRGAPWPFFRPASNDVVVFSISNEDGPKKGHVVATMCSADFVQCPTKGVDLRPTGFQVSELSAVRLPNGKFAVAATVPVTGSLPRLGLFVTDGTPQGTVSDYASINDGTGSSPSIGVDTKNQRLVIVTMNETKGRRLYLTRCQYDGTGCGSVDIGADAPEGSGNAPSLAVDLANEKLLIVSSDASNGGRPRLTRCNLDGTACRTRELSGGQTDLVVEPRVAIDSVGDYLVVVTNPMNKVGVIRWGL